MVRKNNYHNITENDLRLQKRVHLQSISGSGFQRTARVSDVCMCVCIPNIIVNSSVLYLQRKAPHALPRPYLFDFSF